MTIAYQDEKGKFEMKRKTLYIIAALFCITSIVEAMPRFMSLPFRDLGVALQQGWYYDFTTRDHKGIDYVKRDGSGDWISFDIFAAHNGQAKYFLHQNCQTDGQCRWGNYNGLGNLDR